MINRRQVLISGASLTAGAGLLTLGGKIARAQPKAPIKVGFLMPLTGSAGKIGNWMLEGSRYAADEINQAGGVLGSPIELVLEDTQAQAKMGVDGFRKLVDVNGTPVIITGFTAVTMAIAPLSEQSKTFLLTASTASPVVRGVSKYLQSTWMFEDEGVKLIVPYAKAQLGVKRLAVLTLVSDLGKSLSDAVKKQWTALGMQLVGEETHQQLEPNFRPSLLKLLTTKPDAIYVTNSTGKETAQIVKQARDLGYKGIFLSYGAFEAPEVLALGDVADNCFYTVPNYDPQNGSAQTKAFVAGFKQKFGRDPGVHEANHYDVIHLIKQVSEDVLKAGSPLTGETFRTEFQKKYQKFEGAASKYQFDFSDGSVVRATILKAVKGGAFVKVADLV
jgi:ABC-type branched-subunit amino acid transport system substrate-binding protein